MEHKPTFPIPIENKIDENLYPSLLKAYQTEKEALYAIKNEISPLTFKLRLKNLGEKVLENNSKLFPKNLPLYYKNKLLQIMRDGEIENYIRKPKQGEIGFEKEARKNFQELH